MRFLALFLIFLSFSHSAKADDLLSPTAQCATIKNDSAFTLNGSVRTAYGTAADGTKARHESNFRLPAGESTQACSTGPFYPGYQVELILKTLFPVFTCKTRLAGTIYLRSERDEKNDRNKLYAVCIPPDPMGLLAPVAPPLP